VTFFVFKYTILWSSADEHNKKPLLFCTRAAKHRFTINKYDGNGCLKTAGVQQMKLAEAGMGHQYLEVYSTN